MCFTSCGVCVSYLAQVAKKPGVCMWLAEAGQPVCEPGVSRQQLRRPHCDHSSQSCTDHNQDLTEDLREDTLEERHPGTERERRVSRGCLTVDLLRQWLCSQ